MKTITQNATAALFEKAEEFNHKSTEGWKCIYFRIPDALERQVHSLPEFDVTVVTHLLTRVKGFAYLCENGEIFILYRGNYNSLSMRLSMYLWSLYPAQMSERASHRLFSFFDLSKDWNGFYRLCEKRYVERLASSELAMMATGNTIPAAAMAHEHVAGYLMGK